MRPRTEVPPIRNDGASDKGALKEAFIRIRVWLTVGRRCRTAPASQTALAGTGALAASANKSAGAASDKALAAEPSRNPRRLPEIIVALPCIASFGWGTAGAR